MASVSLKTNSGDFVTDVTIPDFIIPPSVVVWGTRVFVAFEDDGSYREGTMCFAQAVIPALPGQLRERIQEDPFVITPRNWPAPLG